MIIKTIGIIDESNFNKDFIFPLHLEVGVTIEEYKRIIDGFTKTGNFDILIAGDRKK